MGVSKCCLLDCNFLLDPPTCPPPAPDHFLSFPFMSKFEVVPMFPANTLPSVMNGPKPSSCATVCSLTVETMIMNRDAAKVKSGATRLHVFSSSTRIFPPCWRTERTLSMCRLFSFFFSTEDQVFLRRISRVHVQLYKV